MGAEEGQRGILLSIGLALDLAIREDRADEFPCHNSGRRDFDHVLHR